MGELDGKGTLRLALGGGASSCLSDSRTQEEKHPERCQSCSHFSVQCLAFLLGDPFYLLTFPCPLPNSRAAQRADSARSGPCALARTRRCAPFLDPPFQLLCPGGMRRLGGRGQQSHPPPAPPAPGPGPPASTEIGTGAVGGAKPRSQHRGPWVQPPLRPLNGRLCSSPRAAERARGRRHNGSAPTPARCAKVPRRAAPSPALRPARSLARRAAADSIASFMSFSLSSRHSPPPPSPSPFFFLSCLRLTLVKFLQPPPIFFLILKKALNTKAVTNQ